MSTLPGTGRRGSADGDGDAHALGRHGRRGPSRTAAGTGRNGGARVRHCRRRNLAHERLGKVDRARDLLLGRAVVGRLRHPGDADDTLHGGGGVRRRSRCGAAVDGDRRRPRDPVFSYRQTIKAYPSAGGAYIVTKDNFGLLPAQVAGVALLTDYVLTVAVSRCRPASPRHRALAGLRPLRVELAVRVHRGGRRSATSAA